MDPIGLEAALLRMSSILDWTFPALVAGWIVVVGVLFWGRR